MPLKEGSSAETVQSNISELAEAGYPLKQRVAIALAKANKLKSNKAPPPK